MRTWLSLGALTLGAVLLVLAVSGGRGNDLPATDEIVGAASLSRAGISFGDSVGGTLEVLVPTRLIDPETVQLRLSLRPLSLVGDVRREVVRDGGSALVRYRLGAECIAEECVPPGRGAVFPLPEAFVRYRTRAGEPALLTVSWPQLSVSERVSDVLAAGELAWKTEFPPLASPGYRAPPRLLAAGLGLLAVALAVFAAALLESSRRAAIRARPERPLNRRALIARALAAVRSAALSEDTDERRRALDLLARELRAGARRRDAFLALRLAWSRRAPTRNAMEELVQRVEVRA